MRLTAEAQVQVHAMLAMELPMLERFVQRVQIILTRPPPTTRTASRVKRVLQDARLIVQVCVLLGLVALLSELALV